MDCIERRSILLFQCVAKCNLELGVGRGNCACVYFLCNMFENDQDCTNVSGQTFSPSASSNIWDVWVFLVTCEV